MRRGGRSKAEYLSHCCLEGCVRAVVRFHGYSSCPFAFLLPSFLPSCSFPSSLPLRSLFLLSQAVWGMIANKKGCGRLKVEIGLA